MSLNNWLQNGWLVEHSPAKQEIHDLLAIADRDLLDCGRELSADWKLGIAYNAALQLATAALMAAGFRASRGSHHYYAIQSLGLTIGWSATEVTELDRFRKKRNISDYERANAVSDMEATRMIAIAQKLRVQVEEWIRANHPALS